MRLILIFFLCPILFRDTEGHSKADEYGKSYKFFKTDEECGDYAYKIIKPMIAYFEQVNQEIKNSNEKMESKSDLIDKLQKEVTQLRIGIAKQTYVNVLIKQFKEEIESEMRKGLKCESDLKGKEKEISEKEFTIQLKTQQIDSLTDANNIFKKTIEAQQEELKELKAKAIANVGKLVECEKHLMSEKNRMIAKSCASIDTPGVHNISLYHFEVLCNSDIAGTGWTIIQQRIRGGVNFQRDWVTFKNGFGDFWDGDFFIGLEKIHKLTNEQPHELYIHMQFFNGSTFFARYDEFAISGEKDQYRLTKLGVFSGSAGIHDQMKYYKNMMFTTYDRDNDNYSGNCATYDRDGGWWYNMCISCTLNGKYFPEEVKSGKGIWWQDWPVLKEVRMMIRPKHAV